MAIDVQAEAEKIAESFVRIRTTGTTIEGAAAVHAAEVEICGSNIIDLVTRVVAEAKREQMEADCKAVCVSCREKWAVVPARVQTDKSWGHECYEGMPDIPCKASAIRTAFAATDRQSIRECNSCEKQSSAAAWAGDVCPMCEENNAKAETEPRLSPDEVFRLAHEPDAPRAFMEIANRAHAEHEKATEPKIVHGLTCNKVPHTRDGYLHGEDYDGPYDVDGLEYCGRCHFVMPSPATEPRDVAKDDPRQRLDKAAIARDEALEEAAIHRLVEAMRAKLAENRHKPNWRTQKASYLIDRVMQETVELHAAVINDKLPSDVWSEAADVANLAMMVADCFGAQSAARELGLDGAA